MLTLMLVALWPLVTSHCKIEQLPGFGFLACVGEKPEASHQEDCETDSCAAVESGLYKTEDGRQTVPTPPASMSLILTASLLEAAQSAGADNVAVDVAPSDLRTSWQFSSRAALPPRAPSLLS
jgi:hypothetical protein